MNVTRRLLMWGIPVLLLIGLSAWYRSLIPPFEGPDEPEHTAYVFWLVEKRRLPPQGEAAWETPVRQEAGQPPLYYLLAALPTAMGQLNEPTAVYRPNPYFPSAAPGNVPDNKNVAVHYPADTRPLRGQWLGIYLARLVSLLFGVILVLATLALAGEVWPGHPTVAFAAGLLVALTPQVIFLSSVISNEMAVAALSTAVLWLLARLLRHGPAWEWGLLLGLVYGLALLAKSNSLLLAPVLAAGFGWLWWQHRQNWRAVVGTVLAAGTAVLLVAGWWYGRNALLYGSPFGLETHCFAPWAYCDSPAQRQPPLAEWIEVFQSYWAAFGWGNIKFAGWVYGLLGLAMLGAAAGLIRQTVRRWRHGWVWQTTAILFLLLALACLLVAVSLEVWMQTVTAPHGRLLYPAIGAASVLLAAGWYSWRPRLELGMAAAMLLPAILAPIWLIRPAYAPPPLLDVAEIAAIRLLNWRMGNLADLLAVETSPQTARAGEALPITVCWRPLAQSDADYAIFVHLVGPQNQVVARRQTFPGLGSYPTSVWQGNRPFCDVIRLEVPADLAETLRYQVEVGLIAPETGERLPVWDENRRPINAAFATAVRLESTQSTTLTTPPVGDTAVRLAAHDTHTTWSAAAPVNLTLQWWVAEPVSRDYTVFIHLQDQSGALAATFDGPPKAGWYPTSWWTAGELVTDRHTFTLPPDLPPGVYDLLVGLYDPQTDERLGKAHHLTAIQVTP